jgi:hypothetical protein
LYTVLFAGIDHQEVQQEKMYNLSQPTKLILNPFNYFEWKIEISLLLRSKGLYQVTMGTKKELTATTEKIKYFNKLYESIGMICLSIYLYISSFMSVEPLLPMWSGPHWKDYSASRMQ